jgi:hypothetical protein
MDTLAVKPAVQEEVEGAVFSLYYLDDTSLVNPF